MPNFQNANLYFENVRDTVNKLTKIFLNGSVAKTIGQTTYNLGKGQSVAVNASGSLVFDSPYYIFPIHDQQLELEQTINGQTYKGLTPAVLLNVILYNNVSNVISSFANDEFGKLLYLNDYLDVTNSGCYFIGDGKKYLGKTGYSSLIEVGKENTSLFIPNEDTEIGTNSFFFPTLSFVKSFESVPYLFNINFQPKMKTSKAAAKRFKKTGTGK